jgi:hypothetical protein
MQNDEDGRRGMEWWNGLTDDERHYWAKRAATGVAADAWELYKATVFDRDVTLSGFMRKVEAEAAAADPEQPTPLPLPRRPSHFTQGTDLAVGTYHVTAIDDGAFTVVRTVGLARWYPLTAREDPAWRTWPSHDEAARWIDHQGEDLCDYPFWGR